MRRFLLLLLVSFLGCTAAEAKPVLQIDDPIWNVGIIVTGAEQRKTLKVRNAGDEPLVIEKVEQCCGFFGAIPAGTRLLPGESAELHLTLKLIKMVGDLNAEISLFSNDPVQPKFSVFALGQVVPKLHALAELKAYEIDLGVVDLRDRVPFRVGVRSVGNDNLQIRSIEKRGTIVETAALRSIAAGGEGEMFLEFRPQKPGPIEEKIVIASNDALNRPLEFLVKGYVTKDYLPAQALGVFPVGKEVSWDVMTRSFTYGFTVANRSPRDVEVVRVESSLPVTSAKVVKLVPAGQTAQEEVTFGLQIIDVPVKGYVYVTLALPVEVR